MAAQLVAQPTGGAEAAIPHRSVDRLADAPGVRAVAALRYALIPVRVGPLATQASATVTDPAALGAALRLTMLSGQVEDLDGGVFSSAATWPGGAGCRWATG